MDPVVPLLNRTVVQNAFVVTDIEVAMERWTRVFGVGPWFYNPDVNSLTDPRYRGQPSDLRFAGALAQAGSVQIELIQPLNDVPSCYRDLYPKGTEGPHHLAIFAEDFDAECARYAAEGFEVAFSGANRDMRFAYYDTSSVLGVMVEILEDVASVREAFGRIKAAGDGWDGTDPIRASAQKPT
jgi:catechol 2,3-dioxygenase-like lactoylglutathione lyase family enzyme